jgi:hypothetical protein
VENPIFDNQVVIFTSGKAPGLRMPGRGDYIYLQVFIRTDPEQLSSHRKQTHAHGTHDISQIQGEYINIET